MESCGGQPYLQPYREAVRHFGGGFDATLWTSRDAQILRFDVMIDLAGFEQATILDAGCGPGDFAAHLHQRCVPFARYIGVDAVPEMIDAANRRGLDRCTFCLADLVHDASPMCGVQADFVCISGTLNTMDEPMARTLVEKAFDAAAQGVVFNFLSDRAHRKWKDKDIGPARRFDTAAWVAWAMGKSSRVTFTQDYLDGHDATILLRHD